MLIKDAPMCHAVAGVPGVGAVAVPPAGPAGIFTTGRISTLVGVDFLVMRFLLLVSQRV